MIIAWNSICSEVVDRMREYVRPFVVPLSKETKTEVRLIGTGTFVRKGNDVVILTCEHVARHKPLNFRLYGYECVYHHKNDWTSVEAVDAAWTDGSLSSLDLPQNVVVKPHQLATQHATSCQEELLFFYGYSGENSFYGFGVHHGTRRGWIGC